MKEKLHEGQRQRQSGRSKENISIEENEDLREAEGLEIEVNVNEEVAAISSVLQQIANEKKNIVEKKIFNRLTDGDTLSEEDKNQLVEKLFDQQKELDEKYNNQREYNEAALRAKLEARKKVREAKNKEDALRKKMTNASKEMVC